MKAGHLLFSEISETSYQGLRPDLAKFPREITGLPRSGLGLLAGGVWVFRRKDLALVFAPFVTLLLSAFSPVILVLDGDFIPSGLMGSLGLVALVLYCALPAKESL